MSVCMVGADRVGAISKRSECIWLVLGISSLDDEISGRQRLPFRIGFDSNLMLPYCLRIEVL